MLAMLLVLQLAIDIEAQVIPECPEIQVEGSVAVLEEGRYTLSFEGSNQTINGPKRVQLKSGKTVITPEGCNSTSFEVPEPSITTTEVLPKKKSMLMFSFLSFAVGMALLMIWRR